MWTIIIPLVFFVIFFKISLTSIFPVKGSISAKITFAPVYSTACAVAVCVWAGTITSSPFLKPAAKHDKWSPAVQLDTETAYFAFVNLQNSFSNKLVYLPCVNHPLLSIFWTIELSWLEIFEIENFISFIIKYI